MAKFHISDTLFDDDIFAVRKKVRLGTSGDISFETPLKSGHDEVKGICPVYESHRYIKQSTIENCLNNTGYDKRIGDSLKKLRSESAFTMLTLKYDSKPIPTDKQITQMADLQYTASDAIVLPSWYGLIRNTTRSKPALYRKLSDSYYEAANFRNSKPFFASIPQCMPPTDLQEVVDHCVEKLNVTSFIVDSSSRSPLDGSWMRPFLRALHRHDIEKECVLYSINAYQGQVPKYSDTFEAEDFLGFGASFDILGGKHGRKFGSEKYDDGPSTGHAKQFDPESYSYRKIECRAEDVPRYKRDLIESQSNELNNIRNVIKNGNKLLDLLNSKKLSAQTIKNLEQLKKYSSDGGSANSTLDDYI